MLIASPFIQFSLPADAHLLPEEQRMELESRLVTNFYETQDARDMPLLMDSQDRHTHSQYTRNGVFIDGGARRITGDFDRPGAE